MRGGSIPSSIEEACDVIVQGYTARVDVGLANGRPFLNAASLGLATAIAKRLTQRHMVAPEAALDDRRLHVYAITAPSADSGREGTGLGQLADVATLARVALSLRSGHHVDHPAVTYLRTCRLEVDAEPVQEVNADGELIGRTPMRFELVPSALRVYAPAPAPDAPAH